jgi:hypothetical protein
MFGINVGRIFASSVVRKLAYVLVALLLGMVGIGRASAQDYSACYTDNSYGLDAFSGNRCPDRPTALANVKRAFKAVATSSASASQYCAPYVDNPYVVFRVVGTFPNEVGQYIAKATENNTTSCDIGVWNASRTFTMATECPNGKPWSDVSQTCGNICEDKPNLGPSANKGGDAMCKDGCSYKPDTASGALNICFATGPDSFCSAKSWKATGETCSTPSPPPIEYKPDKPVCVSMMGGNATECVKPDGSHCMVGARGTTLCWSLGETGPRVTADGKDGGDRQKSPNTPNPPPNMKDPVVTGNSTTTINGDTYNTNNYGGSGSSGGQGNAGSGGNDPGAGGDGKDTSKDPKPTGGPGPGLGRLYEAKTDTAASVYSDFKARMAAAPIANAATGFFTAPSGGGCPTWTIPATDWYGSMSFDAHCGGAFGAILGYCGFLVLAAAAFGAFRIAFY